MGQSKVRKMTIYSKSGDIPTHQYCYVEQSYITGGELRGVEPCVWFGIVAYTGRVWADRSQMKTPPERGITDEIATCVARLSTNITGAGLYPRPS